MLIYKEDGEMGREVNFCQLGHGVCGPFHFLVKLGCINCFGAFMTMHNVLSLPALSLPATATATATATV